MTFAGAMHCVVLAICVWTALAAKVESSVPDDIKAAYDIEGDWYQKYVDAFGVPVLGSSLVTDEALLKATANMATLLRTYPYWPVPELQRRKVFVVILARGEKLSDIPKVLDMFNTSLDDGTYWGGMGATDTLPIIVGTEANLLDNENEENVFVNLFAGSLMEMALVHIDSDFRGELATSYSNALNEGLWNNTFAQSSESAYWSEGVQSYFDVNREGPEDGDGAHNNINTRAELIDYDEPLYALLERVYPNATLTE